MKITRIFLVIIGVGFLTFLLIVSSPREIDATLGPGARFTYLIPILVIIILGILEGPILFVRSFFLPRLPQNFKERIIETIVLGLFLTFSMIIAFVWFKSAVVFGILFFPMIVQATFWLGIGLMFIVHIFEKIHQSIHPMLFFIAFIIAIGIGSSQLYLIF